MLRRCFALLSAVALILGATESAASEKKYLHRIGNLQTWMANRLSSRIFEARL